MAVDPSGLHGRGGAADPGGLHERNGAADPGGLPGRNGNTAGLISLPRRARRRVVYYVEASSTSTPIR